MTTMTATFRVPWHLRHEMTQRVIGGGKTPMRHPLDPDQVACAARVAGVGPGVPTLGGFAHDQADILVTFAPVGRGPFPCP